ncbi:hypothetical protein Gotur_033971 [Gossypium turneri]
MWQMFGGIAATEENAWAPSSGVLPSGVPMGDDAPNEGFGDSDEHSNENEGIPPDEVPNKSPFYFLFFKKGESPPIFLGVIGHLLNSLFRRKIIF